MKKLLLFFISFILINFSNISIAKSQIPNKASANGKYSNLLQTLKCRNDRKQYGNFKDFGYWAGGAWCGQKGKAGYWVWVYPNWYIWSNQY